MPKNIHQLTISADTNPASADKNSSSNNNESTKTNIKGIQLIEIIIIGIIFLNFFSIIQSRIKTIK